jgi:dihydropteroate synthase
LRGLARGADIIRVHDVAQTKDALALFTACLPEKPSLKGSEGY